MARLLHFNDRRVLFPLSNQALARLPFWRRTIMGLILLIILIVLLVGARNMAIQSPMGILSKRRPWHFTAHPSHSNARARDQFGLLGDGDLPRRKGPSRFRKNNYGEAQYIFSEAGLPKALFVGIFS